MKTGKHLEREAWFLAKVPLNSWTKRLIWWAFRKYLLNEDHWKVHMRFTGPRPYGTNQDATVRANATHRRMYVEMRNRPPSSNHSVMRLVDRIDEASKEMTGRRIDFPHS